MIPPGPRRHGLLSVRLGRVGVACTLVLAVGAVYGPLGFLWELSPSLATLVFPVAGLTGAALLLRRHVFLCAIFSGVVAMMLMVSTLMATDSAFADLIPQELAGRELIARAFHAMLTFSSVLSLIVLLGSPEGWSWRPPTRREQSFAQATLWPALLGSQVLAAMTIRGPLVTEAGYWSDEYAKSGAGQQDVGLEAIGLFLLVYSILAGLRGYGRQHMYFKFTLVAAIFSIGYFRLFRGERASVVGFGLFFAILYYMLSSSRYKGLVVGVSFALAFVFLRVWGVARWEMVSRGILSSVGQGFIAVWNWTSTGSGADRFSDAFWYLLQTANLYDLGIRRSGATYLNLFPQMVPAAIADAIGFQRPLTEPWVLAEFVPHGGGIHMVAEAYWNFGLAGMVVGGVALGWILILLERMYRRLDPILFYGYFGILMLNVAALTTGVQAFVRGIEIALLVTGLGWLLMHAIDVSSRPAVHAEDGLGTN